MQVTLDFDDNLYQDLLQKVGKDNLNQFIQAVIRPQLYVMDYFKKSNENIKENLVNGLTLQQRQAQLQRLAGSWQGILSESNPCQPRENFCYDRFFVRYQCLHFIFKWQIRAFTTKNYAKFSGYLFMRCCNYGVILRSL